MEYQEERVMQSTGDVDLAPLDQMIKTGFYFQERTVKAQGTALNGIYDLLFFHKVAINPVFNGVSVFFKLELSCPGWTSQKVVSNFAFDRNEYTFDEAVNTRKALAWIHSYLNRRSLT